MTSAEIQSFPLPANMDLDSIDSIRDWLSPAVDTGSVALDGAHVERVYTNCLLMLICAAREAVSHGHNLMIKNASSALRDAISSLGLKSQFSEFLED